MKPEFKPIGVGDLLVVKQKLVRYAAGEIAHIENVMATESRGRRHRRLRRLEETVEFEFERTEENQRDLQSTERFELQQETQRTIQSDTKFQVGAEVAAGFGPVQIGVSTEFSTSTSKTESDRNATNYAKEITDRSLNKLVERVREQRTTRTLEEVEEKNFHTFENADGDNRTGIYRWVDKYYRVKVVNYGRRLFYEFIVGEPAAFYVFARTHNIDSNLLPPEPPTPANPDDPDQDLLPEHITRENYLALARQYGAGIGPPPRETVRISRIIGRDFPGDAESHWSFVDSEMEIPEGYVYGGRAVYYSSVKSGGDYWFGIHLPRRAYMRQDGVAGTTMGPTEMPQVQGIFPIGAHGRGLRSLMINVVIWCTLTGEAFAQWQLKTYNTIMNAYKKELMNFEEQLAAAQIQQGVEIGGNPPQINRAIEREELKKGVVTLWTGYRYDGPAMITHHPDKEIPENYPDVLINPTVELSPEIKFIEQAFDWKNMSYEFYPYYWARKKQWLDIHSRTDTDPLFQEFLKAGAARVLVPVHPAFTQAVLFYQLTGKLWTGGDVPMFTPPDPGGTLMAPGVADQTEEELALYQDYVAEMQDAGLIEELDRDVDISPDDPQAWMIKVPTTLVWLQSDPELPDLEAEGPDNG
ncbi:hypothetical protein [Micromonospora sp. NPDC126480]|uniref:hypothetical protein n=1 Tax=Micromonospora sp. NPDC126480 TaxID=3155312 RepID=UPI003329D225